MMKTRSLLFVVLALLGLALVPLHNLWLAPAPLHPGQERWSRSYAYRLDFLLPYVNRVLYAAGISSDPGNAIIGRDGWLYLGDAHRASVTHRRAGANGGDLVAARAVDAATRDWQRWLAGQGVQAYRVLVCADKESVYPAHLPRWAQPQPHGATDVFFAQADRALVLDTRAALRAAAAGKDERALTYFRTDTHWNSLGAWTGFQVLASDLARSDPDLRVLTPADVTLLPPAARRAGDLARFLRLDGMLIEQAPRMELKTAFPTLQTDYLGAAGAPALSAANVELEAPRRPLLVRSANALNSRRVLWLRDSFGLAMSPYMAAMFSDVVQVHYLNTNPALLAQLVQRFKPDYVVVSVVERDVMDRHFTAPAPR